MTDKTEPQTALTLLDVIDGIVDDTHPEGDGCPLCVALDDLREAIEREARSGLDAGLLRDVLDHIGGLNALLAAYRVGSARSPEKALATLDRTADVPSRLRAALASSGEAAPTTAILSTRDDMTDFRSAEAAPVDGLRADRQALWEKFTGGEKLAYGCGYRDGRAIAVDELAKALLTVPDEDGQKSHSMDEAREFATALLAREEADE